MVKPDVVFFGEPLPNKFFKAKQSDFAKCDMLIVLGTSLKVHPFAGLIHQVPKTCPRMLINLEYAAKNALSEAHRDFFLKGTCDEGARRLAEQLGWTEELEMLINKGKLVTKL